MRMSPLLALGIFALAAPASAQTGGAVEPRIEVLVVPAIAPPESDASPAVTLAAELHGGVAGRRTLKGGRCRRRWWSTAA